MCASWPIIDYDFLFYQRYRIPTCLELIYVDFQCFTLWVQFSFSYVEPVSWIGGATYRGQWWDSGWVDKGCFTPYLIQRFWSNFPMLLPFTKERMNCCIETLHIFVFGVEVNSRTLLYLTIIFLHLQEVM